VEELAMVFAVLLRFGCSILDLGFAYLPMAWIGCGNITGKGKRKTLIASI